MLVPYAVLQCCFVTCSVYQSSVKSEATTLLTSVEASRFESNDRKTLGVTWCTKEVCCFHLSLQTVLFLRFQRSGTSATPRPKNVLAKEAGPSHAGSQSGGKVFQSLPSHPCQLRILIEKSKVWLYSVVWHVSYWKNGVLWSCSSCASDMQLGHSEAFPARHVARPSSQTPKARAPTKIRFKNVQKRCVRNVTCEFGTRSCEAKHRYELRSQLPPLWRMWCLGVVQQDGNKLRRNVWSPVWSSPFFVLIPWQFLYSISCMFKQTGAEVICGHGWSVEWMDCDLHDRVWAPGHWATERTWQFRCKLHLFFFSTDFSHCLKACWHHAHQLCHSQQEATERQTYISLFDLILSYIFKKYHIFICVTYSHKLIYICTHCFLISF